MTTRHATWRRRFGCVTWVLALFLSPSGTWGQHELSSLCVTGTDPLFTTYAAPLSRSQFVLDEGYQFKFYEAERGIEFATDNGGSLGIVFKMDGRLCYLLRDMHGQPVVTASYSDLVRYQVRPFADIDVQVSFQVYSSRIAIQETTVGNVGQTTHELDIYLLFSHPQGVVEPVVIDNGRGFACGHEEPPDWWTTEHGIPHCRYVTDLLLLDARAQGYGGYNQLGGPPLPPLARQGTGDSYCLEWGEVRHADGSLCLHQPPEVQQLIWRLGREEEILTEETPQWGEPSSNVPGNGLQACELGNFRNPPLQVGDTVMVAFTCSASGEQGVGRATVSQLPVPGGIRVDVILSPTVIPPAPRDVCVHFAANNQAAVVSWVPEPGCRYSLYRRTAGTPGRYDLVAKDLTDPGYLDMGLNPDSSYRYVLLAADAGGRWGWRSQEAGRPAVRVFFADVTNSRLSGLLDDEPHVLALQRSMRLHPGERRGFRLIRAVIPRGGNLDSLVAACDRLMSYDMDQALREDEAAYACVPEPSSLSTPERLMYWSAFSMMRQCMMPPEGECSFNYYLFSREPTWGWGHGGQVFHESLAMLAYAYMDPEGAQNSQRVFAERMNSRSEWPDGYIPYRVGPYLNELLFWANEHSSSAPWFNWENWEVFRITGDTIFLRDMYECGSRFHDFWVRERDDDRDGLCEWGGDAFLESVRDYNVIWHLLGGYTDPHNANKVEALDLNCELVMEERSLAKMAAALGRHEEAQRWERLAQARADAINALMWDPETRFYYHVEKNTHTFTYRSTNDLRRKELIGFLPLWASVANQAQARYLVAEVQNPSTFGRPYGVPLLAHDDPYDGYDAQAVYPEWNYLVFRGLLEYGYYNEARDLAERVCSGVIATLSRFHDFYESYHCDMPRPSDSWLHTYIWTGVVARMLLDLNEVGAQVEKEPGADKGVVLQVYPNPFNTRLEVFFTLDKEEVGSLVLYDVAGREVCRLAEGRLPAGQSRKVWDGASREAKIGSGVYFLVLRAGTSQWSTKIALVK
ncbi:MAG: trehalase family glycosidase [candidate division KSB1 bacterium]|nr:trehalase family glycosidase [candidate division KSB1 bacterium]